MAAEGHAVLVACRVLAVSESGIYAQRHRPPSTRSIRHAALTDSSGASTSTAGAPYGARRVHAELTLGHGRSVGRCAVELLMRRAPDRRGLGTPTLATHPQRGHGVRPRRTAFLARRARPALRSPRSPSTPTREGKLYCAVGLDVFSRLVVGWSIDSVATAALVTDALSMAIEQRARRDGDPLRPGHRSPPPGRSRGEHSIRGSCPRWARSGVASTTP